MPITLTTRTFTPSDPVAKHMEDRTPSDDDFLSKWIHLPFAGYILLSPQSVKVGVAYKISLSPEPVVILHCDETKRSCLIAAHHIQLLFHEYDSQVTAVARGASNPVVHALLIHCGAAVTTLTSLQAVLHASAKRSSLRIDVKIQPVPARTDAILLERGMGNIQCLISSSYHFEFNPNWWPELDPNVSAVFLTMHAALETLRAQVATTRNPNVTPIACLYDEVAYPSRLPILTEETRNVLALVKREMAAAAERGADRTSTEWSDNPAASLDNVKYSGVEEDVRDLLLPMWLFGPLCTICAKENVAMQCSGCGMEFYCSAEHQREDWPHHKGW